MSRNDPRDSYLTCFSVYYPILVLYFCILFVITMKRQIQHMIKYKVYRPSLTLVDMQYIPFDFRKVKYSAK